MGSRLVSIVTPFYNTSAWLPECIDSVLSQTYEDWEYVLLDNCSTDGSSDIARKYAARDRRVRYERNLNVLPQVRNYNAALSLISSDSHYCKMVQADDWIFPDCVRAMVSVFESSPSIGLVGSYYLKGPLVRGYGLPFPSAIVPGRDVVRLLLRNGLYVFGSPSAVMYRSSVVRAREPFYDETHLHEDTDACIQILQDWDFGFVHQVLSFLRTEDGSITAGERSFGPDYLDGYIAVRRYAPRFLPMEEAETLQRNVRRAYYSFLAESVLAGRKGDFWDFHREGLKSVGEELDWSLLVRRVGRTLVRAALNPGLSLSTLLGSRKWRTRSGAPRERL